MADRDPQDYTVTEASNEVILTMSTTENGGVALVTQTCIITPSVAAACTATESASLSGQHAVLTIDYTYSGAEYTALV